MSALRRPVVAALTFLFVALLSAFVWSEPRQPPHSFRVEVTGRGRPMILMPSLASSGDAKRGFDGQ